MGETTCVSDNHRPGTQFSENWPRRAWHSPQVSTSLRNVAGATTARGIAGLRIDLPSDVAALVELNDEPLGIVGPAEWPPALPGPAPSRRAASPVRGRLRSRR